MVKQRRRSEMTADAQAKLENLKRKVTNSVSCEVVNSRGRRGVIKMKDRFGNNRVFYDHQIIAAQKLWLKQWTVPILQGRKAGLACLHDMGLGKTITAILMIGGIRQLLPDVSTDELSLIVSPLSVLKTWYNTFHSWTTYKDKIVMIDHQSKLTADVMKTAKVVLITPDVLVQAFKTFMWKNPKAERWTTKAGKEKYRWGFCHGIDPKDSRKRLMHGDKLPPVHPLFKYIIDRVQNGKHAFSAVVVDEVHKCSNPRTWSGHIIRKLCQDAIFTVGLTGTPVRAKPKQVAWIVQTLNLLDSQGSAWLQEAKHYTVQGGGEHCVRRSTVNHLHNEAVDRVDDTVVDLQPMTKLTLEYDPFIGRKRDGSTNKDQTDRHDSWLIRAQRAAQEATESEAYKKAFDEYFWQAFTTMGQFTFDATLGFHGAEAFEKEPDVYYKLAARQPSQTVRLIWRMVRDRQSKGHPRIVVYSVSTVMLTIARNYLSKAGRCGRLFLYTGKLNLQQRDTVLKDFLHTDTPKGVLFISSAGAIGTNLCPECDTMFVVGDVPWNNSELAQAHGRVHRITQDKPVEIVQFSPRRSVTAAKLLQHEDKRDRLEPAMRDADFTNFTCGDEEERATWRERATTTLGLTTLDEYGNYKMTAEMEEAEQDWKRACEDATRSGGNPPAKPSICNLPDAELADVMQLPPVSWPVPGFVEPASEDEDDDDDDDPSKGRTIPVLPPTDERLEPTLDSDDEEAVLDQMLAMSKFSKKRAHADIANLDAKKKKMAMEAKTRKAVQRFGRINPDPDSDDDENDDEWLVDDTNTGSEQSEDEEWGPPPNDGLVDESDAGSEQSEDEE